ncbi:MAG: dienelactone hydrolase family protein [Actinomycetota bacterium]
MSTDPLQDFSVERFGHDGTARDVLWAGSGPGLVIMTEMPGITPEVADFARRMVAAGFTVALPDLFGTRGEPASSIAYLRAIVPACVSRQWAAFARGRTAPVVDWLRALARHTHERCGGEGVGVLGMCWTGGFALGVAVDPSVRVPVLSQPSLPLGPRGRDDLHLSTDDLTAVSDRLERQELCAIGLRFTDDPLSPAERFETLRRELGDSFIGVEIDSSDGNQHGFGTKAHSVLTAEYRAEPGHPCYEAEQLVIEHFDRQLRSG